MTNSAIQPVSPNQFLIDTATNKDRRAQMGIFVRWLDTQQMNWWSADLRDYREYLLKQYRTKQGERLSLVSVSKYVEAARRSYAALATDNTLLDKLYASVPAGYSPADREAEITRLLRYVNNNANPEKNTVKLSTKKHKTDQELMRLSFQEAIAIVDSIGRGTKKELRDTAIAAFLFATGLRVAELCALTVDDLQQTMNGRKGVVVLRGKNDTQRFVIDVPEMWRLRQRAAEYLESVPSGVLFRPFESRHYKHLIDEPLAPRTVQTLFTSLGLHPHQARHSYARILVEEFGYSKEFVQEQLAHASIRVTEHYIGKQQDVRFAELERRTP